MDISKIVVFGLPFMKALKAVLAVAPRKEPRDLVQFRIVGQELFISARSLWEVITVEVPTKYIDIDYERDEWFEISRGEAQALSAMRMKAHDKEEEPMIGLQIHEDYVLRTDESGLGLGLRSVKVKRHQPIWESQLGNIPGHMQAARYQEPTVTWPILTPEQWALSGRVAAAMQDQLTIWSPTPGHHGVIQNLLTSEAVTMSMMCSQMDGKMPDDAESSAPDQDFVDEPLFDVEEDQGEDAEESAEVEAEEPAPTRTSVHVVRANPPGGLA